MRLGVYYKVMFEGSQRGRVLNFNTPPDFDPATCAFFDLAEKEVKKRYPDQKTVIIAMNDGGIDFDSPAPIPFETKRVRVTLYKRVDYFYDNLPPTFEWVKDGVKEGVVLCAFQKPATQPQNIMMPAGMTMTQGDPATTYLIIGCDDGSVIEAALNCVTYLAKEA